MGPTARAEAAQTTSAAVGVDQKDKIDISNPLVKVISINNIRNKLVALIDTRFRLLLKPRFSISSERIRF